MVTVRLTNHIFEIKENVPLATTSVLQFLIVADQVRSVVPSSKRQLCLFSVRYSSMLLLDRTCAVNWMRFKVVMRADLEGALTPLRPYSRC